MNQRPEWASEPTVLMKALVGSRLYNLDTDDSDYDYRYIQVSPLAHALSPFRNLDTKSKIDGKEDDTVWEFRMFAKYAANGNPSVYEALFSDDVEFSTEQGLTTLAKEMRAMRRLFLDARRVFDAHRGYSTAQLKKMNWEDPGMRHRKAIVAYLRILRQGSDLLSTGTFNPRLSGEFQCFLMEVKEAYTESMRPWIESKMHQLEDEIARAYERTVLGEADHPYIEDLICRMYSAKG